MAQITLCQPATMIVLISAAGAVYHLLTGNGRGIIWWLFVGLFGGAVFQGLCIGGLEPMAWAMMMLPVLLVCFFLALALFSSSIRVQEQQIPQGQGKGQGQGQGHGRGDPCGRCGRPEPECGCGGGGCDSGFC